MKHKINEVMNWLTKPIRRHRLSKFKSDGLPLPITAAISYLLYENDRETIRVASTVETIRKEIAAGDRQSVEILYSPQPDSSSPVISGNMRPKPGIALNFSMKRIARTGKNKKWGSVLYLLARESKAEVLLELGTCAGISGAYLASSPYCRELHTVEGSLELSKLARENLKKITNKAHVYNDLFDDALDKLLPSLSLIDLAFIDGHHEKLATIHYWERIAPKMRPGGIIVFDDIAWSQDMRDGWLYLSKQKCFSHAIDMGSIGVCIYSEENTTHPQYWDVQSIVGRTRIGKPHGWNKTKGEFVR